MSLAEKWEGYRATLLLTEPTWRGIKEAFYAGAEAVSNELPHDERMEFECEIAAFKKGSVR